MIQLPALGRLPEQDEADRLAEATDASDEAGPVAPGCELNWPTLLSLLLFHQAKEWLEAAMRSQNIAIAGRIIDRLFGPLPGPERPALPK